MQCSIASPIFIIPHEYLTTTADSHDSMGGTHCFSVSCRTGVIIKSFHTNLLKKTEPQFFHPARSSRGPKNNMRDHDEVPAGEFSDFRQLFSGLAIEENIFSRCGKRDRISNCAFLVKQSEVPCSYSPGIHDPVIDIMDLSRLDC
jgi:hypothetical protein